MFVGKDVATALGYAKPQNALATHVDEEDKTTAPIQGTGSNYITRVTFINESGLYATGTGEWHVGCLMPRKYIFFVTASLVNIWCFSEK